MKKKAIIVISILLVIGIAVIVGLLFNKNQQNSNNEGEQAVAKTDMIPQLNAYYGNEKIGEIDGYTMEMEEQFTRDVIIPVAVSRQVPMEINVNNNKIDSIAYEIESTDDKRLIDGGEITGWEEKDGKVSFTYVASAILDEGTEYFLKIKIKSDKYHEVCYYARIMASAEDFVEDQIKFAKDFSNKTFDTEKATKLALYLEPDASLANDNLGKITLNNNYSMLTWSTLKPEKITDTEITAKDFCIKDSGEAGTYTMTYQIKATNGQKVEETYNVAETITVWTFAGKQYVLAYNREVNQVWEANANNVGNSFIDLGIQNRTDIEHVESENQQFMAYAINGDVYVMDVLQKKITTIYKLNAADSEILYKTRAKVIKVDDSGNVDYMIYGYSPSDQHVGKNGISIMEYSSEKNESVESAFIPCTASAAVLENQLSNLCHVGDGTLYIMLENTIYFANLKTKEWGVLMANMESGSYAISDDGTVIAYNTTGKRNDSDSITIVDLTNGNKNVIDAGAGNKIAVCGYTGSNLVYGLGNAADVGKYNFFPMYKLQIVDKELNEIKSYSRDKVIITGVEITDTIINIKRQKKGKAIADDQLLDNTEDTQVVASTSYYLDNTKQKELAISFTNNLDTNLELQVIEQGKVTFDNRVEVKAVFEEVTESRYYVYGYGRLQGIHLDKKLAEKAARDVCGLVTDANGQKIWVFEENYE